MLDTEVVVAGLLWRGPPYRLLDFAIDELEHTLNYPKFPKRIGQAATTPAALALRYSALVSLVSPLQVQRVVPNDADDDQVLACALAADAGLIVTRDKDLRTLDPFRTIRILPAREALALIAQPRG